ncbi:MAG TPA: hypothetical protein PKW23_01065 [Dictyoglomaceae bacterium]|nr:hypothetical protein [Dictyoglomaceae bacterium]HOL38949.1 hypothetical protein [Dictyoglomaceae bacterium]HOP94863.1 hypothetical protein [Dictyoglomaceae bacterium]HPP15634.1 hypothetical protein [Dictyoglomaceae bacterium]HPU43499.1 hypothetical protein [Dictyoglomaceae bacterium]
MDYIRSSKYNENLIHEKIMGPNPIKLAEELLTSHQIPNHATVMDLGCGRGLTSEQIIPIHANATDLPFAEKFFDTVIPIDFYNYFGRDTEYLGKCLLPLIKHGGYLYIAIPGMTKDCHGYLSTRVITFMDIRTAGLYS